MRKDKDMTLCDKNSDSVVHGCLCSRCVEAQFNWYYSQAREGAPVLSASPVGGAGYPSSEPSGEDLPGPSPESDLEAKRRESWAIEEDEVEEWSICQNEGREQSFRSIDEALDHIKWRMTNMMGDCDQLCICLDVVKK